MLRVQVRQLLQEVEHMQERHMQLQQQQQPPVSLGGSNGASSPAALEPAAVLLCGDFNTTPDSDTVRVSRWTVANLRRRW
jgi:endonuclease/exonuclease/phosphatase family metal-dependent hydrolase